MRSKVLYRALRPGQQSDKADGDKLIYISPPSSCTNEQVTLGFAVRNIRKRALRGSRGSVLGVDSADFTRWCLSHTPRRAKIRRHRDTRGQHGRLVRTVRAYELPRSLIISANCVRHRDRDRQRQTRARAQQTVNSLSDDRATICKVWEGGGGGGVGLFDEVPPALYPRPFFCDFPVLSHLQ